MKVYELIELLSKVEDKTKVVKTRDERYVHDVECIEEDARGYVIISNEIDTIE